MFSLSDDTKVEFRYAAYPGRCFVLVEVLSPIPHFSECYSSLPAVFIVNVIRYDSLTFSSLGYHFFLFQYLHFFRCHFCTSWSSRCVYSDFLIHCRHMCFLFLEVAHQIIRSRMFYIIWLVTFFLGIYRDYFWKVTPTTFLCCGLRSMLRCTLQIYQRAHWPTPIHRVQEEVMNVHCSSRCDCFDQFRRLNVQYLSKCGLLESSRKLCTLDASCYSNDWNLHVPFHFLGRNSAFSIDLTAGNNRLDMLGTSR